MMEFGETLRQAREAKGLTISQVAQTTHLLVQQVEALEREDFSRIAAPIYGRGFVKLYCEALGLDPKPLVAEFMEIYSGNRQPAIKMRRPTVDAAKPPAKEPILSAPPAETADMFSQPAQPAFSPEPEPTPETSQVEQESAPATTSLPEPQPAPTATLEPETPPPPERESPHEEPAAFALESETIQAPPQASLSPMFEHETFNDEFFHEKTKGRPSWHPPTMADDYAEDGFSFSKIPKTVWRMLALAAVAAVLLWLIISGARAIYRATMQAPAEDEATQTTEPTATKEPASATAPMTAPATAPDGGKAPAAPAARKPMKVPPLYID